MSKERKINVMQCRSTYTTGGGPDKTALLVAERANPEKFRVILMYMRGAADEEFQIGRWAREKHLTVYEILERGKLDFSNLREIHGLIRRYQIDIYHARDYKTCFIGFLLKQVNPRLKLVFTAHGWINDSAKARFYTWLNLISLRKYQRIIAVSRATKQIMVDSGIKDHEIEVVYNAIDVDAWSRARVISTLREELRVAPGGKVVGVVGRLSNEKGLSTTLAVAKRVLEERSDTYFVLVGDGPARAEIEREAVELKLSERVLFLGFRKDAMNLYAGLDLFLSTSLTEGIPNTVLEAMAMEVPVVHTAVGGVPEMIEDGVDGILCRVGDVEGISGAVLSVLNDEEKAQLLRMHGRETVCSRFSFPARMRSIERIYEEVVVN